MKRLPVRKRVWLLLLIFVGLVLGTRYLALRLLVDQEGLKSTVERILSEQFAGRATVEKVKIGLLSGVEVRGIRLYKSNPRTETPFISVDSVGLHGHLWSLLQGRFVIREVDIERPIVILIRNGKGVWNIEQKVPGPVGGGLAGTGASELDLIAVHDAGIELRDEFGSKRLPRLNISRMHFTATPSEPERTTFRIMGRFSSSVLGACVVSGSLDQENGLFNLAVSRNGIVLDEDIAGTLRAVSPPLFERLAGWKGRVNLQFGLSYDLTQSAGLSYEVAVRLLGCDVRLRGAPYALEGLAGLLKVSDAKVSFQNVRGRWGAARLFADGSLPIADPARGSQVEVSVIGLPLDQRLAPLLGKEAGAIWKEYNPAGKADLLWNTKPQADRGRARPTVSLFLKDCAFSPAQLDDPILGVNGQVDWDADGVAVRKVEGRWRTSRLRIAGAHLDSRPGAAIDFSVNADGLELDEKFKALLPKDAQEVWGEFNPKGLVNAQVRAQRPAGGKGPLRMTAALACVRDCEFTYQYFPRRLTDLQGVIEFRPEGVAFRGVTAQAGKGKVAFSDTVIPFDPAAAYNFEFEAKGVEFDRELYEAMSADLKRVHDRIHPGGQFDLEWHQEKRPGAKGKTIYDVVLRPRGASMTCADAPYPLTGLRGEVRYDGSKVVVERLAARRGEAVIRIEGRIPQTPDGGVLNVKLAGRDIPLDDALKGALPEDDRALWDKLAPTGRFQFDFQLQEGIDEAGRPLLRYTIPELRLLDCAVNPRVDVAGIHGKVRLTGEIRKDPKDSWTSGEVDLDSITVEGRTYRNVTAGFHSGWDAFTLPNIEARCYGGKVAGQLKVFKGARPEEAGYEAFFRAENVSAAQLSADAGLGMKDIAGNISAELRADSRSWSLKDLSGDGSLRITEGRLGDLASLLGVTGKLGGPAARTAFTDLDVEYTIAENKAVIRRAAFLGPALNLKGEGKMSLDGRLSLEFHPEPSREKPVVPGLGRVVDEVVSAAFVVSVTGTVRNPIFRVDPLIPISRIMQGLSETFGPEKDKPPRRKPQ